jgi:hypothetical protein
MASTRRKRQRWQDTFNVPAALRLADEILAAPPAWPWIERVPPRGELVLRAVLPLELVEPQNRTRYAPAWLGPQKREACYRLLALQARTLCYPRPLDGRPLVRAVRFSCSPTDKYSDGFKLAIDRLCTPRGRARAHRLGLLREDSPAAIDLQQWQERAPLGHGLGLIEVYTG